MKTRKKLFPIIAIILFLALRPANAQECRYISWNMLMAFDNNDVDLLNAFSVISAGNMGMQVQSSAIFDTEAYKNVPIVTDGKILYSRTDNLQIPFTDNPVSLVQGSVLIGMKDQTGNKALIAVSSPPPDEIKNFPTVFTLSYRTLENTSFETDLFYDGGSHVTAYSVSDSVAFVVNVRREPMKITTARLSIIDSTVIVKVDSFLFPEIQIDSLYWVKISPSGSKVALATDKGAIFFSTNLKDAGLNNGIPVYMDNNYTYDKLGGIKSVAFSPRETYFYALTDGGQLYQVLSNGQLENRIYYNVENAQQLQLSSDGNMFLIGAESIEILSMPDYDVKTINHINDSNRETLYIGYHQSLPNICAGILPVANIALDYSNFSNSKTVRFEITSKFPFYQYNVETNDFISDNMIDFNNIGWNIVSINYTLQFDSTCTGFEYFNGTYWIGTLSEFVSRALRGKDFYFGPNDIIDLTVLIPSFMLGASRLYIKVLTKDGNLIYNDDVNVDNDLVTVYNTDNYFSFIESLRPGTYWYIISSDTQYVYGMFLINK